ncbi:uncharacterized protein CTRU02_206553 [Colletotrichum truncatum]|uniref:Uncharacterized protein n=1 Tax=Colletotrichum truncatum TaxID=5467 RepID=A0ACC3Z756_COLTU|nr:uncharacterized protein CTRU02_11922 [Colletotrichum truncatum]KAF6785297.1 hypothetical protein CTRU02_11922 [Colletotrichum truncatum]
MPSFSRWARKLKPRQGWLPSGWRRSAIVNIGLMSTCVLILLGILATAISRTQNVAQVWKFYTADCKSRSVSITNTLLHLFLNVLSTTVLASSNFFMQVLNAPSRREVAAAHARGDWLDIGIPSWRNAFRLSRFKAIAWIILFITSLPIHMFFNSSIFQMDGRMGDFHVTVATESFLEGGRYYLPGASLFTRDLFVKDPSTWWWSYNGYGTKETIFAFENYRNNTVSSERTNVSIAATNASEWSRLDTSTCRTMYTAERCNGLRDYSDVVLVTKGSPWRRSDLWNLSSTAEDLWEPLVPKDETNALWFATQCHMEGTIQENVPLCNNKCNAFMTTESTDGPWHMNTSDWYRYPSAADIGGGNYPWRNESTIIVSGWNSTLYSASSENITFGFQKSHDTLEISHCLAKPRDLGTTCAVALSKPLLLGVVVSILIKILTCIGILYALGSEESLVTPGDAIASFLSTHDGETNRPGLLTQDMVRKKARNKGKNKESDAAYVQVGPRQWVDQHVRRAACVPRTAWFGTYSILVFGDVVAIACFAKQLVEGVPLSWIKANPADATSVISPVDGGIAFIASVLVANAPQLYLSFWYLAYNALITRLEMGREWSRFSTEYRPLRVSSPKGQQIATYRLQLPYRYSIPLMVTSTMLHWLLSNALFIIVSQGNYFRIGSGTDNPDEPGGYKADTISLPPDAVVGLGTSSLPVLMLIILGSIMMAGPIILSLKRLPGYMPVVGSNSLAMAAACRVSPLSKVPTTEYKGGSGEDTELEELVVGSKQSLQTSGDRFACESGEMAYHPLKWGEVEMPQDWYDRVAIDGQTNERVGHLSFGTVLDDPKPPVEGRFYM